VSDDDQREERPAGAPSLFPYLSDLLYTMREGAQDLQRGSNFHAAGELAHAISSLETIIEMNKENEDAKRQSSSPCRHCGNVP